MIIALTALAICIVLIYLFHQQKKHNPILDRLIQIQLYIQKELDFEKKMIFLEKSRQLSMVLIEHTQGMSDSSPIKQIVSELLGLILKIPRMDENPQSNELEKAIHQIQTINEVSDEIKEFFQEHLCDLIAHFSKK